MLIEVFSLFLGIFAKKMKNSHVLTGRKAMGMFSKEERLCKTEGSRARGARIKSQRSALLVVH